MFQGSTALLQDLCGAGLMTVMFSPTSHTWYTWVYVWGAAAFVFASCLGRRLGKRGLRGVSHE